MKRMEQKIFKKLILSGVLFVGLIAITFYLLFRKQNLGDLFQTLKLVNLMWVFIGVGCMFIYMCLDALNIKRILHILHQDISYFNCLRYTFSGFFFSSVTPSASGGQPMQIYYMFKDHIEISHSSLALLLNFASFQLVTITVAIISFLSEYRFLGDIGRTLKILLMIGVGVNSFLLVIVLMGIFSKTWSLKIVDFVLSLLQKLKVKQIEYLRQLAYDQIKKYQEGAVYIKTHQTRMGSVLLTTFFQVMAMHSVTYCVYRAFGLSDFSYLKVLSLQAILYIAVSAIPLPGAVGVSEGGFVMLFATLFPKMLIDSAMLLSRGISFYLFVAISGLVVLLGHLLIAKQNKKKEGLTS